MKHIDVIIIGSGIAALQLAKNLRDDLNVMIFTKSKLIDSNSFLAQGGIAAAVGKNDNPKKHYADTLEAGRFHNNAQAVLALTYEAPFLIKQLLEEGCRFDKEENGELLLGMEGAHSEKRIVHGGGDATGKTIIEFMSSQIRSNLEIIEDIFVYDLLIDTSANKCIGIKAKGRNNKTASYYASHIVIATGGCGQLYSYTSNAGTVTGDGIALAYRAGAEITDMEFIQFHPTLLHVDGKTAGLVSEAVRGEGGRLVTEDGHAIMTGIHPYGDLAPRHVVSQTIYSYLKKGKKIFLDISSVNHFQQRFPTITAICEKNHIDLTRGLIPVVPGSHFLMGGIKTDLTGRSTINRLYAIGEAACTGVHGANRLASNSLLEGLYFGRKLAEWINKQPAIQPYRSRSQLSEKGMYQGIATKKLPAIHAIQNSMMENTGIVRTEQGLSQQRKWLESFSLDSYLNGSLDDLATEDISKVFMMITAWLVTDSALKRKESRGGHFRQDYPCENNREWLGKQIIQCQKQQKDGEHEQIKASFAT